MKKHVTIALSNAGMLTSRLNQTPAATGKIPLRAATSDYEKYPLRHDSLRFMYSAKY